MENYLSSPRPKGRLTPMKRALLLTGFVVATVVSAAETTIYHGEWIDFNKNGTKDVYEDPSQPAEKRIEDLMGQMTIEEKIGQLHQSSEDSKDEKKYAAAVKAGAIGSFLGGGENIE